jgi:hypothetical protein
MKLVILFGILRCVLLKSFFKNQMDDLYAVKSLIFFEGSSTVMHHAESPFWKVLTQLLTVLSAQPHQGLPLLQSHLAQGHALPRAAPIQ